MAPRNSQNVRLKEEVVEAMNIFARNRGISQQHVASVGAWLFMCMPEAISPMIGNAFYEWCKGDRPPPTAFLPKESPELLQRIFNLIRQECLDHVIREADAYDERMRDFREADQDEAERLLDDAKSSESKDEKQPKDRGPRKNRRTG